MNGIATGEKLGCVIDWDGFPPIFRAEAPGFESWAIGTVLVAKAVGCDARAVGTRRRTSGTGGALVALADFATCAIAVCTAGSGFAGT